LPVQKSFSETRHAKTTTTASTTAQQQQQQLKEEFPELQVLTKSYFDHIKACCQQNPAKSMEQFKRDMNF